MWLRRNRRFWNAGTLKQWRSCDCNAEQLDPVDIGFQVYRMASLTVRRSKPPDGNLPEVRQTKKEENIVR